jgi:hypothetical protein
MKRIAFIILISTLLLLSSCIYFQYINQPSMSLPNDIFTVSIAVNTQGGEYEPYFGVCLPTGWTIPGDSLQCNGGYSEVIYYDSLISLDQDNASPAPIGYYWWAGKGVPDTGAVGVVYAELQIQTDSQVGMFSIDYMLGNSYYGVNQQRSDNHLIQITENAVISSVVPDRGYQNFTIDISITGFNTHFSDGLGTENVWLSQGGNEIYANSFIVYSNTSLTANFYIPLNAQFGLWNVNVDTHIDSIITRADGFEILPPPPLIFASPDSLEIVLEPGNTGTKTLTIHNTGGSDLYFDIIGPNYYALQFDGVDDYVEVPDNPSIQINNNITLECWIKFESGGTYQPRIISKGPDGQGYELLLTNESTVCNLEFRIGPGDLVSQTSLFAGNWYHVASTYNGNFLKLYINGLLDTTIVGSGNLNLSNLNLFIGQKSTGAWDKYKGVMDDVRIWNIALSESNIQNYMNKQLTGTETGLAAYWQFNEGIGDTAFDKTPYGNNGILQGGAIWSDSSAPILSLPDWLYLTTGSGICSPNSNVDITISFDATELDTGDYYFTLIILSNDPFHPEVTIPVHMLVSQTVGVENDLTLPTEFSLEQNYPNPFNPSTTIQYGIKERSSVELVLYDILGREVEVLVNEEQDAGYYKINFNAGRLASSIYFYRIKAGSFVETKKMVLVK